MTHRAYVNFWAAESSESTLLEYFERLLGTVPLSAARPEFTRLVVRALSPAETPLVEHDLRGAHMRAADVIAMAKEYPHSDTEYEVSAYWDLWQPADGAWERGPSPLLLLCRGAAYDDGIAGQVGQFEADLGFEHLFTGGERSQALYDRPAAERGQPPVDHDQPTADHEKIGQNIKQLFDWLRVAETTVPIERYQLWSEGEENLEARLDEILSLR